MKIVRNKRLKFFLFLCFLPLVLATCRRIERQVLIETGSLTTITETSVTATVNISDLGEGITKYGHIVSRDNNFTVNPQQSSLFDPGKTGIYTSTINGLNPSTLYYLKAYATTSKETLYGRSISFTTLTNITLPTLITDSITNITQTTAISGGNITSDGGASVSIRGVCWSTSTNPTISNTKTSDGLGLGSFVSNLAGLTANTTYYVRAYATNSAGTVYGNEVNFITSAATPVVPPTLTTTSITSITQTTATSGGNIT